MSCFNDLKSKFLKHISQELIRARNSVQPVKTKHVTFGMYNANSKERKKLYDYYTELCGFKDYFHEVDPTEKEMLFALQEGPIVWMACRSKQFLDVSALNSLYQTGDIPLYRGKQFINKKLFYVIMYDLTFFVQPPTTN